MLFDDSDGKMPMMKYYFILAYGGPESATVDSYPRNYIVTVVTDSGC